MLHILSFKPLGCSFILENSDDWEPEVLITNYLSAVIGFLSTIDHGEGKGFCRETLKDRVEYCSLKMANNEVPDNASNKMKLMQ